jgi:methyl-accepting chemotaxis protein
MAENGGGGMNNHRRTQYLVARKLQFKYIGLILLLMFLATLMSTWVVYYSIMVLMGEKLASVYPQGRLVQIVNTVNFRILLSFFLITPLVGAIGLFLSHQIAGPILRIERFLNNVASGDISTLLTLRRNDELINLADGINNVVESLRRGTTDQKMHLESVIAELDKLNKAVAARQLDPARVSEMVERLRSEIGYINSAIDKYKM